MDTGNKEVIEARMMNLLKRASKHPDGSKKRNMYQKKLVALDRQWRAQVNNFISDLNEDEIRKMVEEFMGKEADEQAAAEARRQ